MKFNYLQLIYELMIYGSRTNNNDFNLLPDSICRKMLTNQCSTDQNNDFHHHLRSIRQHEERGYSGV